MPWRAERSHTPRLVLRGKERERGGERESSGHTTLFFLALLTGFDCAQRTLSDAPFLQEMDDPDKTGDTMTDDDTVKRGAPDGMPQTGGETTPPPASIPFDSIPPT